MARRQVVFLPDHYYHIYNRGANRETIFNEEENYLFLLRRVKEYITKFQISMIAYCLMPNHYHILLRQEGEDPISKFIQAVFNSYSKAFNKAFGRTGTLFEGPFDAIHIDKNAYLIHLCRYIHRNPLEAGLVAHPGEWMYSNYLEWVKKRSGSLVDREFVQEYFPDPKDYERFILEYPPPDKVERAIHLMSLENR